MRRKWPHSPVHPLVCFYFVPVVPAAVSVKSPRDTYSLRPGGIRKSNGQDRNPALANNQTGIGPKASREGGPVTKINWLDVKSLKWKIYLYFIDVGGWHNGLGFGVRPQICLHLTSCGAFGIRDIKALPHLQCWLLEWHNYVYLQGIPCVALCVEGIGVEGIDVLWGCCWQMAIII